MEELDTLLQLNSTATIETDSLMVENPDSLAADSLSRQGEEVVGMVFQPSEPIDVESRETSGAGFSWILTLLFAVFVIISLRFRQNTKYFAALVTELSDVRDRPNTFDETVRETSFLILLNLLWALSTGVLIFALMGKMGVTLPSMDSIMLGTATGHPVWAILACMGVAVVYPLFMCLAYGAVGVVFTNPFQTGVWVKSFLSGQALDSLVMFPLALLSVTLPGLDTLWLIIGGIGFALTKIMFIYKGFHIFFNETSSWVIFLYYLCSLEIVPLILTCVAAFQLCSLLA